MKKYILMTLIFLISITLISCDDTSTDPVVENGTINITSEPTGAEIWLDGSNTGKVTPDIVEASAGVHQITLKKAGYADLSLTISVSSGSESLLTQGTTLTQLGSLKVESEPSGAQIWLDGANTNQVTPYTFSALESGQYEIKLNLVGVGDTTLAMVTVAVGNETSVMANLDFGFDLFGFSEPITIWETTGTLANEPSGLDLSTGNAYGISSADKDKVDIYYFSDSAGNTYIVRSSHFNDSMTRETFFKVSSSANINDGVNSPAKDATWKSTLAITETNYAFLYDEDGNYSKLIIVSEGETNQKAWVKVKWIFNKVANDLSF